MTAPRQVRPNTTHFLTRSTTQQQFLLRPSEEVCEIYEYLLAEAAGRFGIELHAWVAMSNHQHIVFTDTRGNYPEFLAHFDRLVARALNAHWGRWENLWSNDQPNIVLCAEKHDTLAKVLYTLANPVTSDLVERITDWPGASSLAQTLSGEERVIHRPRGLFAKKSKLPSKVTLRVTRVRGYEQLTQQEWAERILTELRVLEDEAKANRIAENKRIVGRKEILAASYLDTPKTVRARGTLRPFLACRNRTLRRKILRERDAFLKAHRNALVRLMAGERGVVFPYGTYRVRRFGVRCNDGKDGIVAGKPQVETTRSVAAF